MLVDLLNQLFNTILVSGYGLCYCAGTGDVAVKIEIRSLSSRSLLGG